MSAVSQFVNADTIALWLAAFAPENAAIQAGRVMLARLRQLAESRENFAFETTLASRTFAPWIAELKESEYQFHLIFLTLPSLALTWRLSGLRNGCAWGGMMFPPQRSGADTIRAFATFSKCINRSRTAGGCTTTPTLCRA
jgi:predicted ABC-type ATPase